MVTIDIEVECENGFPKPEDAAEPTIVHHAQEPPEQDA